MSVKRNSWNIYLQQLHSELHIDGSQLKEVNTFKYLRSHISANGHIDDEISYRVQQANRAYGRLSNRVFHNRNITLTTKVTVYNAVVLLYTGNFELKLISQDPCHVRVEMFHCNFVLGVIVGNNWIINCIIFVSFSRRLDGHLAFYLL